MQARRPHSPQRTLAVCSLAAGLLALLLVLTGWQTPAAMLVGVLTGITVYLALRLIARSTRR